MVYHYPAVYISSHRHQVLHHGEETLPARCEEGVIPFSLALLISAPLPPGRAPPPPVLEQISSPADGAAGRGVIAAPFALLAGLGRHVSSGRRQRPRSTRTARMERGRARKRPRDSGGGRRGRQEKWVHKVTTGGLSTHAVHFRTRWVYYYASAPHQGARIGAASLTQ